VVHLYVELPLGGQEPLFALIHFLNRCESEVNSVIGIGPLDLLFDGVNTHLSPSLVVILLSQCLIVQSLLGSDGDVVSLGNVLIGIESFEEVTVDLVVDANVLGHLEGVSVVTLGVVDVDGLSLRQ
jgi:hypothetical protein